MNGSFQKPVVVPMLSLATPKKNGRRALGVLVFMLSFGISSGVGVARFMPDENRPKQVASVAVAAEPAPVVEVDMVKQEPEGILLLAQAPVEQEIVPTPSGIAGAETVKTKRPRIVVNTPVVSSPDVFLRDAHAALNAGDEVKAGSLFDKALALSANNRAALAGKVYLLERQGKAADLQKMAVDYPRFAAAQAALGRLLAKNGVGAAVEAWEKAVELEPLNENYKLSLAIQYDRKGEEDKALALYRKVAALPEGARKRMDYLAALSAVPE